MNKLFQQLTQTSLNQNPMMNLLKGIGNPQTFVNERINNPQVQSVIKQYGTPENAFRSLCKQRGLDADTTINTIRQFLGK